MKEKTNQGGVMKRRVKKKRVEIRLKKKDVEELSHFVKRAKAKAREIMRTHVLLLSHKGRSPTEISEFLDTTLRTVQNIKERYNSGGIKRALYDAPRPGQPRIFNGKARAHITALACSKPDEGSGVWSLRLLADRAVELGYVDSISHTQVRKILKKK